MIVILSKLFVELRHRQHFLDGPAQSHDDTQMLEQAYTPLAPSPTSNSCALVTTKFPQRRNPNGHMSKVFEPPLPLSIHQNTAGTRSTPYLGGKTPRIPIARAKSLRQEGIEPPPAAWKAAILTTWALLAEVTLKTAKF